MKVAIAVVVTLALLTGIEAPVQAHEASCTGTGTFHVQRGMRYPPSKYRRGNPFQLHLDVPVCVGDFDFESSGTVSGYCGLATGRGATSSGHSFEFSWNGNTMTFSGQVHGELHVTEDPLNGVSCSPTDFSGEFRWLVTGTLELDHAAFLLVLSDPPELPCLINCT